MNLNPTKDAAEVLHKENSDASIFHCNTPQTQFSLTGKVKSYLPGTAKVSKFQERMPCVGTAGMHCTAESVILRIYQVCVPLRCCDRAGITFLECW